jgi:predicted MPP superfamily phosphohydrolase
MSALQIGSRRRLHVRRERIEIPGLARPARLLYASDLHLTARRGHIVNQLRDVAQETRPTAILFGGDLVDRRNGLPVLESVITELRCVAEVLVVPGNHDRLVGVERVRDVVTSAGGTWLPDGPASPTRGLSVCGSPGQLGDSAGTHVLCGHDPAVFPAADRAGFDLVLAGHLHGCQVVLWRRGQRLFPGALFYRFNGLRFDGDRATMFVSRGVADTLPLRFNCPREVLLLDLVDDDRIR